MQPSCLNKHFDHIVLPIQLPLSRERAVCASQNSCRESDTYGISHTWPGLTDPSPGRRHQTTRIEQCERARPSAAALAYRRLVAVQFWHEQGTRSVGCSDRRATLHRINEHLDVNGFRQVPIARMHQRPLFDKGLHQSCSRAEVPKRHAAKIAHDA